MMQNLIKKILEGKNLTRQEAGQAMDIIMTGKARKEEIIAFLTALSAKGETIDEITGCAEKMRQHAVNIIPQQNNLVDTCGTGGDKSGTFNISTVSAFVAAGAGIPIAKHGNRSVSSKCGSADVLEALGVKVDLEPKQVEECISKVGIGFIFAPKFHPAMKHAMPARKEMGKRSIFNILGPLTNPAKAGAQVLGVFSPDLTEVMAEVLNKLGSREAIIVHGLDGLDEITICERTKVSHLKDGSIRNYFLQPEDFNLSMAHPEEIKGGSASDNANITLEILKEKQIGPKRDIVLLNAAAAIVVGGKARELKEGIELAAESIDSGAANEKLTELIDFTNKN
ncbi:MAG: anthranilate phosphoribosyltransferase [bacterium]